MTYRKHSPGAPAGFFATEAAGLRWLAEPGVLPVVEVIEVAPTQLTLQRLTTVSPSAEAAREFGAGLARLHSSGAPEFGFAPGAGRGWFGPLSDPFEVPPIGSERFGEFWAHRLRHITHLAEPELQRAQVPLAPFEEMIEAAAGGAFDGIAGSGAERPSRVHGDLWSGNLMWTPEGGTLIDPAAHGGHRLEDLAMLALFGAPYLEEIFAGYEAEHPMPAGWQGDLPAHYLFGLIAHVYLFGVGYAAGAHRAVREALRQARD